MSLDWSDVLAFAALAKIFWEIRKGNKETTKVNILVNASSTKHLRTIARLARAVAAATGHPDALAAADEAERELSYKVASDAQAARQ